MQLIHDVWRRILTASALALALPIASRARRDSNPLRINQLPETMTDAPFTFLPLGAILQEFLVDGVNIVQAFPTAELYEKHNGPYFGETIGRVANRISNAKLNSLNGGKSYALVANNGPNNLHGGDVGWGKKTWDGPTPVGQRQIPGVDGLEGGESVKFSLRSEDGDEGFPGTVDATVVYTAGTLTGGGGGGAGRGGGGGARRGGGAGGTRGN